MLVNFGFFLVLIRLGNNIFIFLFFNIIDILENGWGE